MRHSLAFFALFLSVSAAPSLAGDSNVFRMQLPVPLLFGSEETTEPSIPPVLSVTRNFPSIVRQGTLIDAELTSDRAVDRWSIDPMLPWMTAAAGLISGTTPQVSVPTTFSVMVSGSAGQLASEPAGPLTVTVHPAPSLDHPTAPANSRVGTAITEFGPTGSGLIGAPQCLPAPASGSLPPGVAIGPDCRISGTATATGAFSFRPAGKDTYDNAEITFAQLTMDVSPALVVNGVSVTGVNDGRNADRLALATDGDGATSRFAGQSAFAIPVSSGVFGAKEAVMQLPGETALTSIVISMVCDAVYNTVVGDRPSPTFSLARTLTSGTSATLSVPASPGVPFTLNYSVDPAAPYTVVRVIPRGRNTNCGITEIDVR